MLNERGFSQYRKIRNRLNLGLDCWLELCPSCNGLCYPKEIMPVDKSDGQVHIKFECGKVYVFNKWPEWYFKFKYPHGIR